MATPFDKRLPGTARLRSVVMERKQTWLLLTRNKRVGRKGRVFGGRGEVEGLTDMSWPFDRRLPSTAQERNAVMSWLVAALMMLESAAPQSGRPAAKLAYPSPSSNPMRTKLTCSRDCLGILLY